MTATITDVVRQFKRDWTSQLEPSAIAEACREAGHVWRERVLTPVVTLQLFFVQILHGNTACSHLRHLTKLPATAEAYCQARMKLPLAVFRILLRAVSRRLHQQTLDDSRPDETRTTSDQDHAKVLSPNIAGLGLPQRQRRQA